jgi:hypothetical protein
MTVAEIKTLAVELGYTISGANKAALITSFLTEQAKQFSEVTPVGTESPVEEGWWESEGEGSFVLSDDTEVSESATYYERETS